MGEKGRFIKDRLQKLIKRMKRLSYNDYMIGRAEERVNELQQRGICCVDKFVRKLFDSVSDKEAYLDILMEGRFAIILARNSFSKIHIEYCKEGPDLKADWNKRTVYFEVTRKRPSEEDQKIQSTAAFVSSESVENIISKIQEKRRQLQSGEVNIVVIWSDTIRWHQSALEEAFKYIKQGICHDSERYKDLSGILFTEGGGVDVATLKQFYLFKNDKASKPLGTRLVKRLESLHEQNPKQLQKKYKHLLLCLRSRGSD